MSTESKHNRRLLVLIAISIVALVLIGRISAKRVPQASVDGALPNSSTVATKGTSDSLKMSTSHKSRVRAVQGKDFIRRRVKSLLNIRSGEIGIITLPEAALDKHLGPSMNPSMLNSPVWRGFVAKDSLISSLEGVLNEKGAVEVRVIDQNITEYSGEDFQLKIEVVAQNTDVSTVRIQLTSNGAQDKAELSVYKGYSLVYRLPPPADIVLVIMLGDDSSLATANANNKER